MRKAATVTALSLLALAACSPKVPDSGAGASALPQAAPVYALPLHISDEGAAIAAETSAVLGVATPATAAAPAPATVIGEPLSAMATPAPVTTPAPAAMPAPAAVATTAMPAPAPVATAAVATDATADGTTTLSDEQNFSAVSSRETIASDAARIEENRGQYVVIEPTDLPPRPDGKGASIVAYALATTNQPGQQLYDRSGLAVQARFESACAKYGGDDKAQEAFLDAGGPKKDRYGMDPDGDGFACYWDPRPFRAARDAAANVAPVALPGEVAVDGVVPTEATTGAATDGN